MMLLIRVLAFLASCTIIIAKVMMQLMSLAMLLANHHVLTFLVKVTMHVMPLATDFVTKSIVMLLNHVDAFLAYVNVLSIVAVMMCHVLCNGFGNGWNP